MLAALLLVAAASAAAPATPVQDEPTAGIDGRILLPSGAPAVGASWSLRGMTANQDRVREFGRPKDWEDPSGSVDADGFLRARFDAPQAYQFILEVSLEGHVTESWRWGQIRPEQVRSLGDVTLRRAGTLEGRILDAEGKPLTGTPWRISAREARTSSGLGEQPARTSANADPETGAFVIEGLPPGPVELKINDRRIGWSKPHRATIFAGKTSKKDIVLDEIAEYADRIVLTVFKVRGSTMQGPRAAHMWLVAEDGKRRNAERIGGRSQSWAFANVGEGTFRVEIDDPHYDPWSQDDVKRGQEIRPFLRGSAAIRLDVRDAAGEPVQPTGIEFTFENASFRPNTFSVRDVAIELEGGVLDHMTPADYTLRVFTKDATGTGAVPALQAGETRDVEVVLTPIAKARGRVTYLDGSPANGILVRLVTPAKVGDSPESTVWNANTWGSNPESARHEKVRVFTDASGAFELDVEEPGRYLVLAGDPGAPETECEVFDTTEAAPPEAIVLELDPGGTIQGRVEFPDGLDPVGRRISYTWGGRMRMFTGRIEPVLLDREGRFEIGPLKPGRVDLSISPGGRAGWSSSDATPLGSCEVESGETTEVTFEYPGGSPALVAFDLTPNELGDVEVRAGVLRQRSGGGWLSGAAPADASVIGKAPRVGPLTVESGTYDLWFAGEGWAARVANWKVDEGELRTDVLDLDRWKKRVRFVSEGKPLAKTKIVLMSVPEELGIPEIDTDDEGMATLDLGAGEYRFNILSSTPQQTFLTAVVDWPLGEGVVDVRFR